jgi:hypothetical protein
MELALHYTQYILPCTSLTHSPTHSLTHGAEHFLRSRQFCSYSRTSQHFMESEGSLPCSQEPSTDPYPEPDQFNPRHSILSFHEISFIK